MAADTIDEVILGKLTRREFRERMETGSLKACLIPTAATEQHLEHLAMEHDYRSCLHVAVSVAERLNPGVLVAPVMHVGISEHHMRHVGTLTALPGGWLSVLVDAIRSMHHAGFKNILVLNGHGGNVDPINGVWSQFLQRFEINLHFRNYWDFLDENVARQCLATGVCPGHAQEFETAFALAAFPENVRLEAMREQADQSPCKATAEAGQALIDSIVEHTTAFVRGMIDGTHTAEVPPFM